MMSITFIENLSNEIFFEIFDYLNGCEIYHAFSNLNYRFQQITKSPSLLLKLKVDHHSRSKELFLNNYQQIFHQNKARILSIHLWSWGDTNEYISSSIIDASFICLESLVLSALENDILISFLPKLLVLPRLISLQIDSDCNQKDIIDIYQFILKLPKLKYFKYSVWDHDDFDIPNSLPVATNEQISTIEYLITNHSCTFDQLFAILSYTPQLRRLKYSDFNDNNANLSAIKPINFLHLTQLSIETYEMSFAKFGLFIKKFDSNLKVLSLSTKVEDIAYLNADQWEKFILKNLPQLEKFYFKYTTHFSAEYETPMYFGEQDRFLTSFWLERKWVMEIEVECEDLIYSICPYKKRWYDYGPQNKMVNTSTQLSKSTRFTLDTTGPEYWLKTIFIDTFINHALAVAQIYHLDAYDIVDIGKLNEVLHLLPEVNTLTVRSFPISRSQYISNDEIEFLTFLSPKNQIKKISLETMIEMKQFEMLTLILPHINDLRIKCVHYLHAQALVGLSLTELKNHPSHALRLLCLTIAAPEDNMLAKLQEMLNVENLNGDFTIEQEQNNIYLQWK